MRIAELRTVAWAAAVVGVATGIFVVSAWLINSQRRDARREALYHEALALPPYFKDSQSSVRATEELGADPSPEAEEMLVRVATSRGPLGLNVSQVDAIRQLQKRKDPKIAGILSGLIRPETLFPTRRAAAEALQTIPCDIACTRSLLSYLSGVDNGLPNVEDEGVRELGPGLAEAVQERIESEQHELYDLIDSALLRDAGTTVEVLNNDYGLNTARPKPFAVDFAGHAKRREFCPSLVESSKKMTRMATDPEMTVRVANALGASGCPSQ